MALPRDPEPVTEYVCSKCERERNLKNVERHSADATPVHDRPGDTSSHVVAVDCSRHGRHDDFDAFEL